jgi:hypothetical protein
MKKIDNTSIIVANCVYGIAAVLLIIAGWPIEAFLVLICGELREMNMRNNKSNPNPSQNNDEDEN